MTAQSEKLLAGLKSESADERYAAWVSAKDADPEVIPEIGRLLEADRPGVRKAADEALKKMVHSVGKETGGKRRAQVIERLLALAAPKQPKWARTMALRHLSGIGGAETIAPVAKMLREPEIQEEAVFCLERIPGDAADQALLAALPEVKDDFRPRVLAALGHRRTQAAAAVCAAAMGSPNRTIAMAGMKALGRIGSSPGSRPSPPAYDSLADWEKLEFSDSVLRYADGLAQGGNAAEAFGLYRFALGSQEEHVQCAAIIGLAKLGTPEAKSLIEAKTQSGLRNVRITAERALGKA